MELLFFSRKVAEFFFCSHSTTGNGTEFANSKLQNFSKTKKNCNFSLQKNYYFVMFFLKKKRFFLPTKTICRIPYQVNSRHVVTAGHCVAVPLSDPSRSGLATTANASSVRVLLGEYSVRRSTEPLPEEEFRVSMVRLHPHYRGRAQVRYF